MKGQYTEWFNIFQYNLIYTEWINFLFFFNFLRVKKSFKC